MRAMMAGQVNPLPVRDTLPGVLLTDEVVQQFCSALDDVLAPVVLTLDCLPAYLDPDTTPQDVVAWLAEWMGVALDSRQSIAQQRQLLRRTAQLLRWRGTVRGIREAVEFAIGIEPEIVETGGAEWSASPGTALPGSEGNDVLVRVRTDDTSRGTARRIEKAVAAVTPAHIRYAVEVVGAS